MAQGVSPDVAVYVCVNCIPQRGHLPRQWTQNGAHVVVREVPCSGKTDAQYLFHVMEGGARGFCVVTCPKGECQLTQGNYRAEVRVSTIRRLLTEIGMEPERAELVHCSPDDTFDQFEQFVHDAVGRICALRDSPIRGDTPVGQASSLPFAEDPQTGSLRHGTKPTAARQKTIEQSGGGTD